MVFTWDVRLFTATLAECRQHPPPGRNAGQKFGRSQKQLVYDVHSNDEWMSLLYGFGKEPFIIYLSVSMGFVIFF